MAKSDKTIFAVIVMKSGVLSLADIETLLKKNELVADVVEPNRLGDPAVLTFSKKEKPKP